MEEYICPKCVSKRMNASKKDTSAAKMKHKQILPKVKVSTVRDTSNSFENNGPVILAASSPIHLRKQQEAGMRIEKKSGKRNRRGCSPTTQPDLTYVGYTQQDQNDPLSKFTSCFTLADTSSVSEIPSHPGVHTPISTPPTSSSISSSDSSTPCTAFKTPPGHIFSRITVNRHNTFHHYKTHDMASDDARSKRSSLMQVLNF